MKESARPWTVRITASADADFEAILLWTREQFGEAQVNIYAETLASALEAMIIGPSVPGARRRDDILQGLYSLHIARNGRRGRQFVMFRVAPGERDVIEVLRILHDSMDLPKHLSSSDQ